MRRDGAWTLQGALRRASIVSGRTSAVAIDGDVAVVGTTYNPSGPAGSVGEVAVFRRVAGAWTESTEVPRPGDLPAGPEFTFGGSLDLRRGRLLVGAPQELAPPPQGGRAYVFDDDGTEFVLAATLAPAPTQAAPLVGSVVALSPDGSTAILGATGDTDGQNSLPGSLVFDVEEAIGAR